MYCPIFNPNKRQLTNAGTEKKAVGPFHLGVESLPAAPGQPVVVIVDGKTVYDSGSTNGDVHASVEIPGKIPTREKKQFGQKL